MKSESGLVAIKGTKHGLTITLLPGPVLEVLTELDERLTRTAAFFKGGQVTLNVENRSVSEHELKEIDGLLRRYHITLRKIATEDSQLAAAGASLGLLVGSAEPATPAGGDAGTVARGGARDAGSHAPPTVQAGPESELGDAAMQFPAVVARRTLRSGVSLRSEGHVIVVGDVNPGAEIIAAGDVIVWGKLRGLVHAGAMGDNNAVVCALFFEPTQLRIGNAIARMPERKKRRSVPEMASIRNGKIEVVEWS